MKKKILSILILILLAAQIFSNDTLIQKQSGGNLYLISQSDDIKILNEELIFNVYDNYYDTEVKYNFYNNGDDISLDVGFPNIRYKKYTHELSNDLSMREFQSTVNGDVVEFVKVPANIQLKNKNEIIDTFFKKNVTFDANSITKISISYKTTYLHNTNYEEIEYLLGSAISWNGIDKLLISINIHSDSKFMAYNPVLISEESNKIINEEIIINNNTRTLKRIYEDVKLDLNCKFRIQFLESTPENSHVFGVPWDYNYEYIVYSENEFRMLTKRQLELAKNTIYAWHGYQFKDQELNNFFENTAWYSYRKNEIFFEENFNENEKANLKIIEQIEEQRR